MSSSNERVLKLLQATPEVLHAVDLILDGKVKTCACKAPCGSLLMNMGEAAKYLGVSRVTLWRMIKASALKKVEFMPGSFRIRRADLDAIAAGNVGGGDE